MEFLCQSASGPTSHIANPGYSQLDVEDALDVEGHRALTNADGANDVQQNVVTAKKGKKRGTKAILRRSR